MLEPSYLGSYEYLIVYIACFDEYIKPRHRPDLPLDKIFFKAYFAAGNTTSHMSKREKQCSNL